MFKKIFGFLKNVKQEMVYISWPTKDDLKESTTVVIVMSMIVAAFLFLVDTVFRILIQNLLLKG